MKGEVLIAGSARGPLLRLKAPISFWGGIDAASGAIVDPRHPDHGRCITGTILALPATIGSSSSASVLLELIHSGRAPAALILVEPDAILLIGAIVAREMGWPAPAALRLKPADFALLREGLYCLGETGEIAWEKAEYG
jgi:uncharacterized protein